MYEFARILSPLKEASSYLKCVWLQVESGTIIAGGIDMACGGGAR